MSFELKCYFVKCKKTALWEGDEVKTLKSKIKYIIRDAHIGTIVTYCQYGLHKCVTDGSKNMGLVGSYVISNGWEIIISHDISLTTREVK